MKLVYHPRTVKFLRKLPARERDRVLKKIEILNKSSLENLNIKKLTTTQSSYRLRVGNIRVVYETDSVDNIIYIHEIDFRGNIY